MKIIFIFLSLFLSIHSIQANNKPLFRLADTAAKNSVLKSSTKEVGTLLTLDKTALNQLYADANEVITISIPRREKTAIQVSLNKKQILSDLFYVSSKSNVMGRKTEKYTPGHYYQNIENGQFAAISLFEESLNGVITLNGINYTLGAIKTDQKSDFPTYIFYDESQVHDTSFECHTKDTPIEQLPTPNTSVKNIMYPILQNYLEVDFGLYESFNQDITETANHVTSVFNVMATIFDAEQLDMRISEISVWTTPNSFAGYSTRLAGFRDMTDCVNGDLAHYLTRGGGGRAYINGLCNGNNFAESGIRTEAPNNYPSYDPSVQVMAHEIGHNLGSRHTHNCSWPNGVIDNCATPEGGCGPTSNPYPNTIMSYCGSSIDLALGFGPLPGEKIRNTVAAATCLEQVNYISIFGEISGFCPNDISELDATIPNCTNCTYNWSDGTTGAFRSISPSAGDNFCVTVTDPNGVQYADHYLYTLYDLDAQVEVENPEICGNGSARVFPSGGTQTYTYLWSDGSTSNITQNLTIGTHSITISDGVCETIKTFEVSSVPSITTNSSFGGEYEDKLHKVIETNDGKLLLVGYGSGIGGGGPNNVGGQLGETYGSADFWAVKTELDGTIIWEKNFGGTGEDICQDVIQTPDGGYLLAGYTSSFDFDAEFIYNGYDGWIVKIDANGNKLWTKKYGGTEAEAFHQIIASNDGNYFAVGQTGGYNIENNGNQSNNPNADMFVVKFDGDGNEIWSQNYGGNQFDSAHGIIQNTEGDLFVVGHSKSEEIPDHHGFMDIILLRLDANGNKLWEKAIGGSGFEYGEAITLDASENIAIAGTTYSSDFDADSNNSSQSMWFLKLDQNGAILNSKIIGPDNITTSNDIISTEDGGFLLIGNSTDYPFASYTFGNLLAVKIDSEDNIEWFNSYGGDGYDSGFTVLEHSNETIYLGGSSRNANNDIISNVGAGDFWLFGLNENTNNNFEIIASDNSVLNGPVTLTANTTVSNPVWSTGATTQSITVNNAGTYTLTAGPSNCTTTASILITGEDCTDNDNDNVCASVDCDDSNPLLPAEVGSPCNDNNPATTNDTIQSDGCTCEGTIIGGTCNVQVHTTNVGTGLGLVEIGGMTPNDNLKLFNKDYNIVYECAPWFITPCFSANSLTVEVAGSPYYLSVQSGVCDEWIPLTFDEEPDPTCNDGIQNQGETGIDCGGPCAPCETEACTVEVIGGSVVAGIAPVYITGLTANENVKLFNASFDIIFECAPWFATPCTPAHEILVDIDQQPYFLSVQSDNCNQWIPVEFQEGCIDLDGDGLCSFEDCNDNEPFLPTIPGTPCNDNDASTENDVYQADGCMCMGTPVSECTVEVTAFYNGVFGGIEIQGLALSYNVKLFDSDYNVVYECNPWGSPQGCQGSYTYLVSQGGDTFYLSVQSENCDEWIPITVPVDGECNDSDVDGICDNEDCEPNNPTIPAPIGTDCNDFDSTTINDVIIGDECTCIGTPNVGACNITITETNIGQITITGLGAVNNVKLFDQTASSAGIVWECNPWSNACNNIEVIEGLDAGVPYYLSVQNGDCEEWMPFTLTTITFNNDTTTAFQKNETTELNEFSIINIFPNPVADEAFVKVDSDVAGTFALEIYDIIGTKKWKQEITLKKGTQTILLDINRMNSGIHTLIIRQNNNSYSSRFIKS